MRLNVFGFVTWSFFFEKTYSIIGKKISGGDPDFVSVPIAGLLSKPYAAGRRKMMTPGRAFGRMPDPGKPEEICVSDAGSPQHRFDVAALENRWGKAGPCFKNATPVIWL